MQKIMIDGVNVAECEYLDEDYFIYDLIGEKHLEHNKCMLISAYEDIITDCSQCPNCYFKQLQRLKEKYDTLTNKFFNSETDKTRLKQENKRLKENYRLGCLECEYKNTKADVDKYKQALEKISKYCKPRIMLNGTANTIFKIIESEVEQ